MPTFFDALGRLFSTTGFAPSRVRGLWPSWLAKIEAGCHELESTPFRLRESFGDTLEALALQVHQKGLELTYSVASDVPDAVRGDPGRLSQVLVNLVDNAQRFTDRGEIAVRVGLESLAGGTVDLHVSVRDTGIGIPPERLAQILAAFSLGDSSTTRQCGGIGPGLTICSRLVRAMGGRIWVESVVGRGSTFRFTARLSLQEGGKDSPVPSRVNRDGLPVPLVDDNATDRPPTEELLASLGMKPKSVDGGPAAIAVMNHAHQSDEPSSPVLLDVPVPVMDGFELAESLRTDAELAGTAIMRLASVDDKGDAGRCSAVGASSDLLKPIKAPEVLDATQKALVPHAPPSARLRVLLAEDNPVNQFLAITLLENRGHAVVVAKDGREAIDILGRESFDLILMDVQMPRMDGFEATTAIRASEVGTGRRMPILAMTAHAMKGDRERCLAAGMDGYFSKPIRAALFIAAVEGRAPARNGLAPVGSRETQPDNAARAFDLAGALARVHGKRPLLRMMAELFLADCPGLLNQMRSALAIADGPMLERAAHRMKGSAANLQALRVAEVAGRLEEAGREDQFAWADLACAELEDEIVHLELALEILKDGGVSCES